MDNKWINTADFKNWYLENFPQFNLTDVRFSMNDIFDNLDSMPGAKLRFKTKIAVAELEDEEGDENVC